MSDEVKDDLDTVLSLTAAGGIPPWSVLESLVFLLGEEGVGAWLGSPQWDAFVQTNFHADGRQLRAADGLDFSALETVANPDVAWEDALLELKQIASRALVLSDNLSQLDDRFLKLEPGQALPLDDTLFAEIYSDNEHVVDHRNLMGAVGQVGQVGGQEFTYSNAGKLFLKQGRDTTRLVARAAETIRAGATTGLDVGVIPYAYLAAIGLMHVYAGYKIYDRATNGPTFTSIGSRTNTADIVKELDSRLSSGTSTDGLAPSIGLTPTEEQAAMRLQAELQILLNSDNEPDPQAALVLIDGLYAAGMTRAEIETALGGLPENYRLLLSNTAVANTGGAQNYWTYLQGNPSAKFSIATEIFYNTDITRQGAFEGLIASNSIAVAGPHTTPEQQMAINLANALAGVDEQTQAGIFGSWASAHSTLGPRYLDRADALWFDTLRVMSYGPNVFAPVNPITAPAQIPGLATWAQTDPHGFDAMLLRSARPTASGSLGALMLNFLSPDQALEHLYQINDGVVSLGTFESQLKDPAHPLNKLFGNMDAQFQSEVLSAIDTLGFSSLDSAQKQAQHIIDLVPVDIDVGSEYIIDVAPVDVDVTSEEYINFVQHAAALLSALPLDQQGAVWAELLALELEPDRGVGLLPQGTSADILEQLAQQEDIEPFDLYLTAAEAVAANHPGASPMMIKILLAMDVPPEDVAKVIAHMALIAYEKVMGGNPYAVGSYLDAATPDASETIQTTDEAALSAAALLVAKILSNLPPDAPQTEIVMGLLAGLAVVFADGGSGAGGAGGAVGGSVAGGEAATATDDMQVDTTTQVGAKTLLPDELLAKALGFIDPLYAAKLLLGPALRDSAVSLLSNMDPVSAGPIVGAMLPADAAPILGAMEASARLAIWAAMPPEQAAIHIKPLLLALDGGIEARRIFTGIGAAAAARIVEKLPNGFRTMIVVHDIFAAPIFAAMTPAIAAPSLASISKHMALFMHAVVDVLTRMPHENAAAILAEMVPESAGPILAAMTSADLEAILAAATAAQAARINAVIYMGMPAREAATDLTAMPIAQARAILAAMNPVNVLPILAAITLPGRAQTILTGMTPTQAAPILGAMMRPDALAYLANMTFKHAADILVAMAPEKAARILIGMPDPLYDDIFERADEEGKAKLTRAREGGSTAAGLVAMGPVQAALVVQPMQAEEAALVLAIMTPEQAVGIVERMSTETAGPALDEMTSENAAAIISLTFPVELRPLMPAPVPSNILAAMQPGRAAAVFLQLPMGLVLSVFSYFLDANRPEAIGRILSQMQPWDAEMYLSAYLRFANYSRIRTLNNVASILATMPPEVAIHILAEYAPNGAAGFLNAMLTLPAARILNAMPEHEFALILSEAGAAVRAKLVHRRELARTAARVAATPPEQVAPEVAEMPPADAAIILMLMTNTQAVDILAKMTDTTRREMIFVEMQGVDSARAAEIIAENNLITYLRSHTEPLVYPPEDIRAALAAMGYYLELDGLHLLVNGIDLHEVFGGEIEITLMGDQESEDGPVQVLVNGFDIGFIIPPGSEESEETAVLRLVSLDVFRDGLPTNLANNANYFNEIIFSQLGDPPHYEYLVFDADTGTFTVNGRPIQYWFDINPLVGIGNAGGDVILPMDHEASP